jgi:hypothetical protein
MKTGPHFDRRLLAAAIAAFAVIASSARAQNIYSVGKSQVFTQNSAAGAVADPNTPFAFSAQANSATTITLPNGGTVPVPFSANDGSYQLDRTFASKAVLDAAFPAGTYRMTGTGIPSLSFNMNTELYPTDTPQVTGGTWNAGGLLVLDPTRPNTITLNTFTGYATSGAGGHMSTKIQGTSDNVRIGGDNSGILSVANPFGIAVTTTPITSITIPANTLISSHVYQGEVNFDTATTFDTTTVAGGGVVGLFSKVLQFYIAALPAGTVAPVPVITRQPASLVTVPGGSATFSFAFTIGGSSPTQSSNAFNVWYFNGQQINADGTKYALNNFGLTVNNITAADAGTYYTTIISPGGIVTSLSATLTLGVSTAVTITRQPISQTVAQGSTAVFSVAATSTPSPSYQWQLNGVNVPPTNPSATSSLLVVQTPGPAQAGSYNCVVSNGTSSANVLSSPATLSVVNTADPGRLINLSIRTSLNSGEEMTMGTVLGGAGTSGTKELLARAGGPSLAFAPFFISPVLPNPTLKLNYTTPSPVVVVATNNNGWGGSAALSAAFAQVGAFPFFSTTTKDAAVYQTALQPGNYTVQVSDAGSGFGTVIAELYDETPGSAFKPTTPRLINVSVRKDISTVDSITTGFYVGGSTAKTLLIRAIGPALGLPPFNIPTAMADPQLTLYNSSQAVAASNDNWGGNGAIVTQGNRVAAFAVTDGSSKDAMLLITLPPGLYTATASPVAGTAGGNAIIEVYEIP